MAKTGNLHETPWGPVYDSDLPEKMLTRPWSKYEIEDFAHRRWLNGWNEEDEPQGREEVLNNGRA